MGILRIYDFFVDRPTRCIVRKSMDFFYGFFRVSPEIFLEGLFLLWLFITFLFSTLLMASAIMERDIIGMLLPIGFFLPFPILAMSVQHRLKTIPRAWTVQRYKLIAAKAAMYRDEKQLLRCIGFLFVVCFGLISFSDFLTPKPVHDFTALMQFFVFLAMHFTFASEATEPPPPNDGDVFFAQPHLA